MCGCNSINPRLPTNKQSKDRGSVIIKGCNIVIKRINDLSTWRFHASAIFAPYGTIWYFMWMKNGHPIHIDPGPTRASVQFAGDGYESRNTEDISFNAKAHNVYLVRGSHSGDIWTSLCVEDITSGVTNKIAEKIFGAAW
jgi:hypothetical protein